MPQQSIEQVAQEACLEVDAEYKDVPSDGLFHTLNIVNDPKGKNDARLKIFADRQGGIAWNHKTGERKLFFINTKTGVYISDEDRAKIKAEQQRRKAELIAKQNKAALKAQRIFSSALPAPPEHPYLVKKRVKPYLTRQANWTKSVLINDKWQKITIENVLLVPLYNEAGIIRNLQAIFPEKHHDLSRDKDFLAGAETSNQFWWVGSPTDTVILAEGVATAFSIHQETKLRCYIAFNAGNLLNVARIIRNRLPKSKLIVACDNDLKGKVNTGVIKGTEAALAEDGGIVVPPISGDFNDLYVQKM